MIRESPSFPSRRVPRTWRLPGCPLGDPPPADAALPDSKCHCPGDTCLLILRLTLIYHTSMAHSVPSPFNPESPLSLGKEPGVRSYHQLRFSRWLKTAQNGPEWPACPTPFLFGERPIFGPLKSSPACVSNTKRPQMAQNGAKTKKLAPLNAQKAGGNLQDRDGGVSLERQLRPSRRNLNAIALQPDPTPIAPPNSPVL